MAISISAVSEKVREYMQKNGERHLAIPWPDFYTLADRGAMRDKFLTDFASHMKEQGMLVSYGKAVVSISLDYAPPNIKHII